MPHARESVSVKQANRALDAANFFLADVRDALAPYLAVYLLIEQKWDEGRIGIVMSIATATGIVAQTPTGALVDATRAKRWVMVFAAMIVTVVSPRRPRSPAPPHIYSARRSRSISSPPTPSACAMPNRIDVPGDHATMPPHETITAWSIVTLATAGVIIRPFSFPEAIWAVAGAAALVLLGPLPIRDAITGIVKGVDVYLFLIGMMLIAELVQLEGLFDYLAAFAVEHARGSPQRLFLLIYAVGTLVTVFLSNDATAIVLTPAVYAATRAAGASPVPYLFVCAFIANAASFVLPLSNPPNLVVFGEHMPHLVEWLRQFTLPSVAAILVTYVIVRLTQCQELNKETIEANVPTPHLSREGKLAAIGICAIGIALLTASALDLRLGLPTFVSGLVTGAAVLALSQQSPWPVLKGVTWSVIPLVAGLFVMVEALVRTGVVGQLCSWLHDAVDQSPLATAMVGRLHHRGRR